MRLEFEPNVMALPLVENELFEDVVIANSPDFQTLLKNGISAAQGGEREVARELLTKAAEIDPQNESAWMWLASISNYPEELLAFLTNVLSINPENERALEWRSATRSLLARTLVQRGIDAHNQGADELAVQCFDQAIVNDETCEIAWLWRAGIAATDDEKLKSLQQVLRLNPSNEEAKAAMKSIAKAASHLALEQAKKAAAGGKLKKAISMIDKVLEDDSVNVEGWILRSHLSVDLQEKLTSLEKVLEIEPENAMARASYEFLNSTVEAVKQPSAMPGNKATGRSKQIEAQAGQSEEEVAAPTTVEAEPHPEPERLAEAVVETAGPAAEISEVIFPTPAHDVDIAETVQVLETEQVEPVAPPAPVETANEPVARTGPKSGGSPCPYCGTRNETNVFECSSCHAALTLSDIETLLANPRADNDIIQNSVTELEAEWNLREFGERELTTLAVGHFNLRNFDRGFKYLQEASRLDLNNVILAGHVNAIAIRLEEMRRQEEVQDTMPKGMSILVVDDSPTVRKLIAGKLEKSGHNVICAVDGVEGLERIAESIPDLVLLDISMPRMDGYEVCREIRSNPASKDLPVVMISGKDGFFDKVRGRMAGATGYITKPFGPETLMKALETYLVPLTGPVD